MVEKQEGQYLTFIDHETISFKTEIQGDGYYVVYSWGAGRGPFSEWDIRGH